MSLQLKYSSCNFDVHEERRKAGGMQKGAKLIIKMTFIIGIEKHKVYSVQCTAILATCQYYLV